MENNKKNKNKITKEKNQNKKNKENFVLFYGVNIEQNKNNFFNIVSEMSNKINEKYKEDFNQINTEIDILINKKQTNDMILKYKYPNSYHITTYFFGKKKNVNKNAEPIKEFEESKIVNMNIIGLIVVPNKIITSIVLPEFSIENKIPHITTFLGSLSAKNSGIILEELFGEKMPFEDIYNNILNNSLKEYNEKKKVKILDEEQEIFIYMSNDCSYKIVGNMKAYSN